MQITIIGAGNMGGALAKGFSMTGSGITCVDKSLDALTLLQNSCQAVKTSTDTIQAVKGADVVIVAVKPWIVESVIGEIKDTLDYRRQLLVSVAAGVGTERLAGLLSRADGELPGIVYMIPNIAAEVGSGVYFYTSANATPAQLESLGGLLGKIGFPMQVEERLMSAGTALSSCGIAYVFRYIRACVEGGVEMGFYPREAEKIVLHTMKGAVDLMLAHGLHPEQEIDKVTTPGGITIKGLNAMEAAGFTSAVIQGLKAGK